jgi:hypothetical protein
MTCPRHWLSLRESYKDTMRKQLSDEQIRANIERNKARGYRYGTSMSSSGDKRYSAPEPFMDGVRQMTGDVPIKYEYTPNPDVHTTRDDTTQAQRTRQGMTPDEFNRKRRARR